MVIFRFNWLTYVVIILFGCEKPQEYAFIIPKNAKQMLSGDSSKTWILAKKFNNKTRMNMEGCFLKYSQTFRFNGTMKDNAEENRGCGETLEATWKFVKSPDKKYYLKLEGKKVGELLNIEEDFKYFKILHLSDSIMQLQYYHKQFSNKFTQITDYWVPEGTKLKDRNFHW
ncbi:MAG: hypothetical protein AAGC64_02335 [Bacteroidota bacterium]